MLKRTDIKQNILYRLESLACCLNACSTLQDWSILSGLAHPSNRYFDYKLDSNLMYCRIHCWSIIQKWESSESAYALHAKWTDFWHSIFMLQCINTPKVLAKAISTYFSVIAHRAFPAPVNLTCAALIEDNDSIPAIGCFAQQAPCPSCNDVRAG